MKTAARVVASPMASVVFVDVGQGDCTIAVDHSANEALMIDCRAGKAEPVLQRLQAFGTPPPRLDTVFITHGHADHFGEVASIAARLAVAHIRYNHDVLVADSESPMSLRKSVLKTLLSRDLAGAELAPVLAGDTGRVGAITWRVLGPTHRGLTEAVATARPNRGSVVLELGVAGMTIVLGADATARTLAESLGGVGTRPIIYRASHHGAMQNDGGLSDADVLTQLSPHNVVVSVGASNNHHHPREDFIRLASPRSRVMCTQVTSACGAPDRDERCAGTVTLERGGSGIRVVTDMNHAERVASMAHALCR